MLFTALACFCNHLHKLQTLNNPLLIISFELISSILKSGFRTKVPRSVNMEKLRNGYLFPEVTICSFQ